MEDDALSNDEKKVHGKNICDRKKKSKGVGEMERLITTIQH